MKKLQSEIRGPLAAYRWLQRVGLRWARRQGDRAQLIRAALRTVGKVRDAAQLAIASKRATWSAAWTEEPPDKDAAAPVWILGQVLLMVHELDAGELDDEARARHRTFLASAEALVCVAPTDEKVEAEAELRGERAVDRRIHGPKPVKRHRVGGRKTPKRGTHL